MGRRQGPKVAASHEPPEAQGQLASLPCVSMETAPAGIRGQKQDFRRGCQQFPDPDMDADPDRYPQIGRRGTQGGLSVPRVRTSPGNPDPRLQRLEGIPKVSGTRPPVMQQEGLGLQMLPFP